jgi:hypothetical protein
MRFFIVCATAAVIREYLPLAHLNSTFLITSLILCIIQDAREIMR